MSSITSEPPRLPVAELFDGSPTEWGHVLCGFSDSSIGLAAAYARGKWGWPAKCHLVLRNQAVIGSAIVLEFSPPGLRHFWKGLMGRSGTAPETIDEHAVGENRLAKMLFFARALGRSPAARAMAGKANV